MIEIKTLQHLYADLIESAKNYLMDEHVVSQRVFCSTDDYLYFFEQAKQKPLSNKESAIEKSVHEKKLTIDNVPQHLTQSLLPTPKSSQLGAVSAPPQPLSPKKSALISNKHFLPSSLATKPFVMLNPPTEKENKLSGPYVFIPEQLFSQAPLDLKLIRKAVSENYPKFIFFDVIPDDAQAKINAELWMQEKKPIEVLILIFNQIPQHQSLLINLKNAITTSFKQEVQIMHLPSVIDDSHFDQLYHSNVKFIIANSIQLKNHQQLLKDYHLSNDENAFLKHIPLVSLDNIDIYLNEPKNKLVLWNEIQLLSQRV